jgi:glycerol kinase
MSEGFILAIDQGTTGSKVLLIDGQARIVSRAYGEIQQYYPENGWVEHDPMAIWLGVADLLQEVLAKTPAGGSIRALAITNQRETTLVWERGTGRPLYRAIVWQCRRSVGICKELIAGGYEALFRRKTGLPLDPYFSGTKLKWLLDQIPGLRARAQRGEACFGTIDSWLLWNLTGGKVFATDYSNASRTLLYNIYDLDWDEELLDILGIPRVMLPAVLPSAHRYGETAAVGGLSAGLSIAALIGDSQAALFGEGCFEPGMIKATYGTGTSLMMQAGSRPVRSSRGLVATLAWGLRDEVNYAYEGIINVTGATMQWLRDGLGIIDDVAASSAIAAQLPGNDGVYLIPAFVGLAAPYWDMEARGIITGLTRATGRGHLIRAGLEAIAYQVREVVDLMQAESGIGVAALRADGGAAGNEFLMQFQADILNVPVTRPHVREVSALGAAYLAGLATGFWRSLAEIAGNWRAERSFYPQMAAAVRERLFGEWREAVARALTR